MGNHPIPIINKINMSKSQKSSNVSEFNKFVENNSEFLEDKYGEHFPNPVISAGDFDKKKGIQFIYDVFSFNKYESDPQMDKTLKTSLSKNIEDFLEILSNDGQHFNMNNSIQLLKYCLENNEMFAVRYDHKNTETNPEDKLQVSPLHQQEQQQSHSQQQQSQTNAHEEVQEDELHPSNEFDIGQEEQQKVVDVELIRKNLKIMFEFYCKQQQNIGISSTFDRINHECHTMTLGKFIIFASNAGIKNEMIDRELLTRKFKLVAQGSKQIDFQAFYQVIQMLAAIDESLIQKLGVDNRLNFKEQLRTVSKPFNTQDMTSRETRQRSYFVSKLTGHSGMTHHDLAEELQARKQLRAATSCLRQAQFKSGPPVTPISRVDNSLISNESVLKKNSVLYPKQISSSNIRDFEQDLNFLEKIVNAEQADERWLRDYKLPVKSNNHVIHRKSPQLPPLVHRESARKVVSHFRNKTNEMRQSETKHITNFEKRRLGYPKNRGQRSHII